MKIAIASGKGGTGKTTVAVAIAKSLDDDLCYADCDVEEPNGHIFLQIEEKQNKPVNAIIPEVKVEHCNGCGICAKVCEFNAIVVINNKPLIFSEMCHSCNGCILSCPKIALFEKENKIGSLSIGEADNISFIKGLLDIGNAMSPPIIREVKKEASSQNKGITILDCPPGTSCPMITSVKGCDYAILVTEPTPFGLNDLKLAVETLKEINIPFGVIINRCDIGDNRVVEYCASENIDILLEIKSSKEVAVAYSNGKNMVESMPELKPKFREIISDISKKYGRA